jgi:hypothetical protein
MEPVPYFDVPLNLPHAGRVARRLATFLHRDGHGAAAAAVTALQIVELLDPYFDSEENPPPAVAARVREQAAALGRRFVAEVEFDALGHDRLGQGVRNYFECLELGREGAALSLRVGEDPRSPQRPR